MKKAIIIIFWWLCSVVVSATNYYIKNGGDDALSGKSDAEAWETLAKANKSSFSPGDTIFLKRGDEWYECLNPISSGASGKPVVYSAYGTGAKPIISFAIQYTGWKKLKNNIYFVTGVYKTISLCLFDGTDWGLRVSTVADLDMHHEYTEVVTFPLGTPDDTLFIYTDVPADTSNIIFAKEAAPVYINGKNYITLEKLNIKYAGAHCLNITGSSYINIDSCKIEWGAAQGIQLSATIQSNVSNNIIQHNGNDGIYATGYSNFNNIHHNLIRNNSLKGGTGGDRQAIGIWFCRDVNVYNNDIIHDGVGSVIEASSTSYYQDRIKFYNNKIIASIGDQTVFSFSAGDYDIYNNVVVITSGHDFSHFIATTGSSITSKFRAYHNTVIGAGTPVLRAATGEILTKESYSTLKNNIFYGASSRYYDIAPGFLPYVVSDNNIFLDDVGTKFWIGPHYNLSGWRSATGEDANSFIADPLFINNAIRDYSLSENSPAINKGAAVGILSDFNGNLRDENPDIGAFEFKTVITPVYLSSSIANATPSVIEMNYNLNLANIVPDVSAFDVRINSNSRSINKVTVSGTKVLLTMSSAMILNGDVVTVSYIKPSVNPLQTTSGTLAASVISRPVINNVNPITCTIENATPSLLEITFNLSLIENRIPDASSFIVKVNSAGRSIKNIGISGYKVTLTLGSPVFYGDVVTVSYLKPSDNTLRTVTVLEYPTLENMPVVNNVLSQSFTYLGSVVNNETPDVVEMNFSLTLANIVPDVSAFDVRINSNSRSISSVSISGTKVLLTMSSAMILNGDIVTVSYSKPSVNQLQTTLGTQANSLILQPVTNMVDPVMYIIENSNPSLLEITFGLSLENRIPPVSAFTVKVNSVVRSVKSVAVTGYDLLLTLASPVFYGDIVTVSYTKPSTDALKTVTGLEFPSWTDKPVTNNVLYQSLSDFNSVVENATPNIIEMNYNQLLSSVIPDVSSFDVSINSNSRSIGKVEISGTRVLLTMSSAMISSGDVVTVSYIQPATNPVQTTSGLLASTVINKPVTNNVYPLASVIENATPSLLEIIFNLSLADRVPAASAFEVRVNSVIRGVTKVAVSGNEVILTLASPVAYGNVVTVAYTKPSSDALRTVTGLEYPSFPARTVTNHVGIQPGAKSYQPGNAEEKNKDQQTESNSGSDNDQSGAAFNNGSGGFTLYPNPARDFINISIPDVSSDTKTLRIYDLSGKLLFEKELGSYRNFIEMPSRFISGTYFVRILSGNIPLYTKKLVIVR